MTTEELRERLAELKQRNRQARIERGLSPDPPKQKRPLPEDITVTLLDRMDKFVEVCVEMSRLYRAGVFEIIDMERLAAYQTCAGLLTRAEDFNVKDIGYKSTLMLALISNINKLIMEGDENIENNRMLHYFYADVVELARKLPLAKGDHRFHMQEKRRRSGESIG